MGPEEGLERRSLVPSHKELAVGVAKEAANIGATEAHAGHTEGETHGDGGLEVAPLRGVVAGPDGRVPLAARVSTSCQDEGAQFVVTSHQVTLYSDIT